MVSELTFFFKFQRMNILFDLIFWVQMLLWDLSSTGMLKTQNFGNQECMSLKTLKGI